jgi:serine/threonine protein kinase
MTAAIPPQPQYWSLFWCIFFSRAANRILKFLNASFLPHALAPPMPPAPPADSGTYRSYAKSAGSVPLPGYTLLSPLGRGGFGEVWKCEAPGGLHKAIKFVTSESEDGRGEERFGQELAAFEQIKAIRHPFLLTLERVEQIDGELVMVMELADRQLQDRFVECRNCGLPGIPREELLGYFADAAEALDVISAKFKLQHLDIKPANLFIVSGHVKVGDYGLVAQLEGPDAGNRGLTPRYVAPEVLHGTPSNSSDQYSLALVYQELLTGEFPYTGRTPQQLMLQHVSAQPNLMPLPSCDQPAVAKALSKQPPGRFPSCLAFVQALMAGGANTSLPAAAMNIRRARVDRSVAEQGVPAAAAADDYPGNASSVSERDSLTQTTGPREQRQEPTQSFTLPSKPHLTVPGAAKSPLPPLVSGNQRPTAAARASQYAAPKPAPKPAPPVEETEAGMVVLDAIQSVMPIETLTGMESDLPAIGTEAFAFAVVNAAAAGGHVPELTGDTGRLADGAWVCQFPSTVPASVVPLKLSMVRDLWGVSVEQPDASHIVLRRTLGGGGFFGGKKYGFEVSVQFPAGVKVVGEITVVGRMFGNPDQRSAREALDLLPKLLGDVRTQLGNVQDRRKHPRIACGLPVTIYPVHSDGGVDTPVAATCRDASLGGLSFITASKLQTKYVYATFPGIPAVAGQAILMRLSRVEASGTDRRYGAQYRTDL